VNTPISGSRISSISVKPASKQLGGAGSTKPVRLLILEAPIELSGKAADCRASLVSAALFLIAPYLACTNPLRPESAKTEQSGQERITLVGEFGGTERPSYLDV
jgi:hypothetical protein